MEEPVYTERFVSADVLLALDLSDRLTAIKTVYESSPLNGPKHFRKTQALCTISNDTTSLHQCMKVCLNFI